MKKYTEVEDYLADQSDDARATLETIRAAIRSAAPDAEEKVGYGMPGFYLEGHPLTYYAAFKAHCSLFPASTGVIKTFAKELAPYEVAKGTIRFPIGKPPPASLIKKIVRERIRENRERFGGR
jgi:uncharacterized protein YdhG (YjbR/CyaY superfamily)